VCRFFALHGIVDELALGLSASALKNLARAAENDRYASFKTHDDGWGFTVFSTAGAYLYKTVKPIWLDHEGQSKLIERLSSLRGSRVSVIAHARKASPYTPKEIVDVHPYVFKTREGYLLSFAHNGSIKAELLGESKCAGGLRRSDSYIFAERVLAKSSFSELAESLKKSIEKGLVKTALNSALSVLSPHGVYTLVLNYYISGDKSYYALYYLKTGSVVIAGSSTNMEMTLQDAARGSSPSAIETGELGNGRAIVCGNECTFCNLGLDCNITA